MKPRELKVCAFRIYFTFNMIGIGKMRNTLESVEYCVQRNKSTGSLLTSKLHWESKTNEVRNHWSKRWVINKEHSLDR